MVITKEYYISALDQLNKSDTIGDKFVNCMFAYYRQDYEKKFKDNKGINNVEDFKYFLNLFFTIPVSFGNTPIGLAKNVHYQDPKIAVNRTIEYFNKYFNIT